MRYELFHGTSPENADRIQAEGFKDRVGSGKSNWKGDKTSQEGFVYLTTAYPIFYATAASLGDTGAIIKVLVDDMNFYPDEDVLTYLDKSLQGKRIDLERYKHEGLRSLNMLGNVAVKPWAITIVGRRDFNIVDMWQHSDPSISPLNYKILGGYYRNLTHKVWAGVPLGSIDNGRMDDLIITNKNNERKHKIA